MSNVEEIRERQRTHQENNSEGPQINGGAVHPRTKNNFRRTVQKSTDLSSQLEHLRVHNIDVRKDGRVNIYKGGALEFFVGSFDF